MSAAAPRPLVALLLAAAGATAPVPVALPGGGGPIGFDDLRFSQELGLVLVPAGRTGRLDLVDPRTLAVESIPGFSEGTKAGGHGDGTTSADSGAGLVFVADRTARTVSLVDGQSRRIVASARLGGVPDYVRWVDATGEVWVTEPGREAIEVLRLVRGATPDRSALAPAGTIAVADGPESLVVDPVRRRAYTNTWHGETLALALEGRKAVARWRNGCHGSRGLAADVKRGLAFVGCEEGRAVALAAGADGAVVGEVATGAGVDVIDLAPDGSRLYVPGATSGDLAVVAVAAGGALSLVRRVPVAPGAHCVTVDDRAQVYVCDPRRGRILVVREP